MVHDSSEKHARLDVTPGAWDAHAHVIGHVREFPFAPGRGYTPPPASLDAYLAMLDRHGLAHGVLVQPSVYGFDNRCLLEALDQARGRLFGVAVPSPDATAADLDDMHRRGVRAVRCNVINPCGLSPDVVVGWQPALRALGWHVELHLPIEDVPRWPDLVTRIGVPVVIDHMGRVAPGRSSPSSRHARTPIDHVRDAACFVKLSAPYRLSTDGSPWSDITELARALVEANPRACLWATDWPHVDTPAPVQTDDLFDALRVWCPDDATRRIVMTAAAAGLFKGG
jgi:predicted TIM-barrel fold metal-dependent hydrolase